MDVCDPQIQKLPANDMAKDTPNCSHSLPVIGFKEFQPSNTLSESKQIEDALKKQAAMLAVNKVDKLSFLIAAEWKADQKLALVTRRAGGHFDVIGHEEGARLWLYAEEILLLLELSRAELWYGGVSMSIQQGYAMLLGSETGCCDVEYAVYKHLSNLGYRILRHKSCSSQYELDIRLNQCSAKSSKKLMIEEKEVTCVDRMPVTLMEDDPAETKIESFPREVIVLPSADLSLIVPVEAIEIGNSRSSLSKETPEPTEEISDDKFPTEFVVLDEWTAADEHDVSANNESASIVVDDDSEIIGVTLEAKEVVDDSFQGEILSKHKSHSDLAVMDEVVKPASPKDLAEICPQIHIQPAAEIPESVSDKVSSGNNVDYPENIPAAKPDENNTAEELQDDDECIFSDLNAFLAEICPSPKRQEDISPISNHAESEFIGVSGVDTSETILNSLAEVSTSDAVDDTDNAADDSSEDDYGVLKPGFNVVRRQNMCPVLLDVPEPEEEGEIQLHGKRRAQTTYTAIQSKRLRDGGIDDEQVSKQGSELDHRALSREPLVNGESEDIASDSVIASTSGIASSAQAQCVDISDSESSEDEDCLNIQSNREELDSPQLVEQEDSDLEIIEMSDVDDLSVTISNKRKRTDDEVRSVKRRPVIEVINLSDEETSSEDSDEESNEESDNDTEDLNQEETDVMSVGSSSIGAEEAQPSRPKYWDQALLEDEDRTNILKSIVNIANKTQVDMKVDWRYIPINCIPVEKRVKVFRLNAIGIGGKPSVDYVPAHKVIEVRDNSAEFVPLVNPVPGPPSYSTPPPSYPPPLLNHPPQHMNPWVQVGSHNFLPNYQLTVHNPFHRQQPPPPPPWQQPSSAFIAPGNMGYAIPGSFPAPPRHFAPLLHVVRTPRMQNRTIRGVVKVNKPQSYESPRNAGSSQGWFQQNNVFNEPNAIHVELPPPVKPEPWQPGVMRKMKDEVPVPNTLIPRLLPTLPLRAVKEEEAAVTFSPGAPCNPANDNIAIGGYTVKKIIDCCHSFKRKQKARLRSEWMKLHLSNSFEKTTRNILKVFEAKSPLLKGLVNTIEKAVGTQPNVSQPRNQGQTIAVKEETFVGIPLSDGDAEKQVTNMMNDCPRLSTLTQLQVANLKAGIAAKAKDRKLRPAQTKVLHYVGRLLFQYAKSILQIMPLPLDQVDALIAHLKLVSLRGEEGHVKSINYFRSKRLNELGLQTPASGAPAERRVIDEIASIEQKATDAARDAAANITDLKTLAAKIEEWVDFTPPMAITWKLTRKKLENGSSLSQSDYFVLHYVRTNEPRLYEVLPLLINKSYMGKNLMKPVNYGINAHADWRRQVEGLVIACPWLNAIGNSDLSGIERAMRDRCARFKNKHYNRSQRLLTETCELIIETIKYLLCANRQPSKELEALVVWANYLNVSGKRYDLSQLLEEVRSKEQFPNEESENQRDERGEVVETIENQEHSSDEVSEKSDKNMEETNLEAARESNSKVGSAEVDELMHSTISEESDESAEEMNLEAPSESSVNGDSGRANEIIFSMGEKSNSEKSDEKAEEINLEASSESSINDDSGEVDITVRRPIAEDLPDTTKQLKALVSNVMAWLTLSEEQNETWKLAKERMANNEAFIEEDMELFRFAARQDERFPDIKQLIDIRRVGTGNDNQEEDARRESAAKEGNDKDGSLEEESRDPSVHSSSSDEEVVEPLLKPSDCTDYASVISRLGIIKSAAAELTSDVTTFKISYDLYLPVTARNTPFRKSDPGTPDYRIVVLRPDDRMPSASDISSLRRRCPDCVPVLFAIVRVGTVSFLRLDAVQLPTDLTEYGQES